MSEIAIPGDEDDFLVTELERSGEMNRVVARKSKVFRVLAGAASEGRIDADRDQVFPQLLEDRECLGVLPLSQAPLAPGSSQSGAPLWIGLAAT
jgi:hypothetical protein